MRQYIYIYIHIYISSYIHILYNTRCCWQYYWTYCHSQQVVPASGGGKKTVSPQAAALPYKRAYVLGDYMLCSTSKGPSTQIQVKYLPKTIVTNPNKQILF